MSPPAEVTVELLASLELPHHDDEASKHDRGSVLVIGGSVETPGAVLLAGLAALRAGGGRLQLATVASCAPALGVAVPESRVIGLADDGAGSIDPAEAGRLAELVQRPQAVLIGPGMLDVDAAEPLLDAVTAAMAATDGVLIVDAGALPAAGRNPEWLRRLDGRALLVPNPSELEALGSDDVQAAAERFGAVVSARGPETLIASPDGRCYIDRHGTVGLATSGSGDVAGGLAAGLAARGATPLVAAVWAAALHGLAGEHLSERMGWVGFLARELLDEVPGVLSRLCR